MKKVIFLSLLTLLVLASCSTQTTQSTKNVTVTTDTVIRVLNKQIITAPRYSCNGKKLKQDKLVGVDTSSTIMPVHMTKTIPVTFDCNQGTSIHPGNSFDWLWDLLKWLGAMILILLALWLLYRIIRFLIEDIGSTRNDNSRTSITESVTNEATTGIDTSKKADIAKITALTALVNAIGAGGGGTVNTSGIDVEVYGVESPLVYVENSGSGSNSKDINIHFGDSMDDNSYNNSTVSEKPEKD